MPAWLSIFVTIFYLPAYSFFSFISFLFHISGLGKHDIASCQTASILYVPVWFLFFVLVYYGLHRWRLFPALQKFISLHRHSLMILYSYGVLFMYSLPVGCEDIWRVTREFFFIHRGFPFQFSGEVLNNVTVKYPFITLFRAEIPSYQIVWYIPNVLANFSIILGMTYLTYFIVKHIPFHIHRHIRKRRKINK